MTIARIIILLAFIPGLAFPQRGPGITQQSKEKQVEIFCDYQELAGSPNPNLMEFIPLFENMYNTNQIKDKELKKKIHCVLLKFYREHDPFFAQDFTEMMPEANCG